MKKTIIITAIALLSIGFNSCTDNEQLESGKINACRLQNAEKLLEQYPDSALLQSNVEELRMFVESNRELYASYGSGSNDEFNKEVDEYLKTCE